MKAISLSKAIVLIAFLFVFALSFILLLSSETFSQPSSIFSINLGLEAKPLTGSHLITKVSIFNPGETIPIYYQENILTDNNDVLQLDLSDFPEERNNNYDILIEIPSYLDKKISNHNLNDNITETISLTIGDLNNDNYIDEDDKNLMLSQWQSNNPDTDFNEDGLVNTIDFGWLNQNWHLSGPSAPQAPLPEPFAGSIKYSNQAGEYEDTIGFVFMATDYRVYLNVESSSGRKVYLLPEVTMNSYVRVVLTSSSDVWIAFGIPLKVAHYKITGDVIELILMETIGNSYSNMSGFIRLADGRLLMSGHQQQKVYDENNNPGVDTWLKLYDNGQWTTVTTSFFQSASGGASYATHEALVQHQDSSIWHFIDCDSSHTIRLVHGVLTPEGIEIDYAKEFITKWPWPDTPESPYPPEGELPWLSAVALENDIILAYQNDHSYIFSTSPFCKGAYITVLNISADYSYTRIFEVQRYTERCNTILSGADWVAYGQIDETELTWNDLYFCRNGTDFTYLGELNKGVPGNAGINLLSSSKWIIAEMSDGKVHFFNIDEL